MRIAPLTLFLLVAATGAVQAANAPAAKTVAVDRILAIVNTEVITQRELKSRLEIVESQLKRQGTPLPAADVLERQVLDRMIIDRVQLQQAKESGLRIDDQQLDQALQRIAAGNQMTPQQFRQALEKDGVPYARFREEIREEMTISRLREREVDQRLVISDSEIDAHIESEAKGDAANDEYALAHVLVRVPESAGAEVIEERRKRAEEARTRLLAGENFAQVAAAYSDAPDGLQGGLISPRPLSRLPNLYAEAVSKLETGGLTPVLRSANGFHVVRLIARKSNAAQPPVQQTRARHILMRSSEVVSEAEVRQKLAGVRERLVNGASFAELARLYSQDGTAAKGGDLGWIYPGDTVPDFERAMDALKPGELSQAVQSPFGWHLIEVQERRVAEVSVDRKRMLARQALREKRSGEAYQEWLRQLRDRAYVELRLDDK
jgi:peptidyl-prolyl cis-trans isomerase SurA